MVEQIGWAAIGCITGGQALSAVSNYTVSLVLGIVIINIVSIVLSFGGYTAIVKIENYFWIVFFIIFLIIYGEVGGKADVHTPAQVTGMTFSGNILSCLAIFYGDGASYSSIISDYYVNYPANISKLKVWLLTTFGIFIPVTFGMLLGCVVASTLAVEDNWANAYDDHGVSGLVLTMLHPRRFAKFLLVLLSLGGGMSLSLIFFTSLAKSFLNSRFERFGHIFNCSIGPASCKAIAESTPVHMESDHFCLHSRSLTWWAEQDFGFP